MSSLPSCLGAPYPGLGQDKSLSSCQNMREFCQDIVEREITSTSYARLIWSSLVKKEPTGWMEEQLEIRILKDT